MVKYFVDGLPSAYCEEGDKVETLEIVTVDSFSKVEVRLFYAVFYDYDVITRWVKITNNGTNSITLLKALSGNIAFDNHNYDVISNFGTWARERQIERAPLLHTGAVVESNCGSQLMNYGIKVMTHGKWNDFYAMMWEFE